MGLYFSWGEIFWEGGDTLPRNNYKPSMNLKEASL